MKKIFLIAAVGILLGGLLGYQLTCGTPETTLRKPSSIGLAGKHQRLFDVIIKPANGIPPSDDKDLELIAEITLLQPLQGEVHFQWVLPGDAQVVEGETSDSVAELPAGQKLIKKLTVQGVSAEGENKIVTLQVWMDVDGIKLGSSGVFATKENEMQFQGSAPGQKIQATEHPLPKTLQQ